MTQDNERPSERAMRLASQQPGWKHGDTLYEESRKAMYAVDAWRMAMKTKDFAKAKAAAAKLLDAAKEIDWHTPSA